MWFMGQNETHEYWPFENQYFGTILCPAHKSERKGIQSVLNQEIDFPWEMDEIDQNPYITQHDI